MAVRESARFKQLVGTARNPVVDLLRKLESWVVWKELKRRCPNRNRGSRTNLGPRLHRDGIDGCVRKNLLHDFATDGLPFSGPSQRQGIEANVVDLSRDAFALRC